jgi:cytochrome c553
VRSDEGKKMPRHIIRLVLVMLVCAVAALAAKSFFTKDSFYRYGHYRADSVPQIAAMPTSFQTPKACATCHELRNAEWSGQAHKTVICEVCHGAAPAHPGKDSVVIPDDTNRLCSQCHERMAGRPPGSVRQIGPEHPASEQCISCHNPHAPRIESATAHGVHAAAPDALATCAGCHGARGVGVSPQFPNLAGQNEVYLVRALSAFHVGERKSDLMGPVGQSLTPADIPGMARFFAQQPCPPRIAATAIDAGTEQAARGCAACHGERGQGTSNASLPRLAGQSAEYLGTALRQFRSGERGNPWMAALARPLSDPQIDALSRYFAAQDCRAIAH